MEPIIMEPKSMEHPDYYETNYVMEPKNYGTPDYDETNYYGTNYSGFTWSADSEKTELPKWLMPK